MEHGQTSYLITQKYVFIRSLLFKTCFCLSTDASRHSATELEPRCRRNSGSKIKKWEFLWLLGLKNRSFLCPLASPGRPWGSLWAPLGAKAEKVRKKGVSRREKGVQCSSFFHTFFKKTVFFSKDIFQTRFFIDFRKLEDPSKP